MGHYLANHQNDDSVILAICSFIEETVARYCRNKNEWKTERNTKATISVDHIRMQEGYIKNNHLETLLDIGAMLEQALQVLCRSETNDVGSELAHILGYAELLQYYREGELRNIP